MTHHRTAAALAGIRVAELRADASRLRLGRSIRRTRRGQTHPPRTAA